MSETDSFIQEVTEEVRQDQMFALWKKWGPYIIGGVVVVVGAAAAWSWMTAQNRAAAEARGDLFLIDDAEARAQLPLQVDGAAQVLAQMAAAAALMESGETEAAGAQYAAVAMRGDVDPAYRDLAALQAIRLGASEGDPLVLLDEMIIGGSPYRLLAQELRAGLRLEAGDVPGAHSDLNAILTDPGATGALRQRAGAVLVATGGRPEAPGDANR